METTPQCNVCQGTDWTTALTAVDHTVSNESFTIQRCNACSFQFTSPRPTPDSIGKYYLSTNYISHAESAHGLKDHIYHIIRKHTIHRKHKLIAKYHPQGSLLDVGCGTGDFLAHLRTQGYKVQGVELSSDARRIASNKGLTVYTSLNDLPNNNQFDNITLWHVLEHVPDPKETLKQLFALAMPGATLAIAVPDRESWDCQHYGPIWAAWDVPRHLFHFRRRDMKRLLMESGFELIQIKHMWFDAPYVSMLSEQYKGANPVGAILKGTAIGLWSNIVALLSNRPTSSSLFLAQKPKMPQNAHFS